MVIRREAALEHEALLKIWAVRFGKLAESRLGHICDGAKEKEKMKMVALQSHRKEGFLLDVRLTAEEMSRAVCKAKKKKAPAPDGVLAQHVGERL